jgi:2'-5' RNA ligase
VNLDEITKEKLEKAPKSELLDVHWRLHQWYANASNQARKSQLEELHSLIVPIMMQRGLHHRPHDKLDEAIKESDDELGAPLSLMGSKLTGISAANLARIADERLCELHDRLHELFALALELNDEELMQRTRSAHQRHRYEMLQRGIDHPEIDQLDEIMIDEPEHHDHVMVAFEIPPSIGQQISDPNGVPVDELHLTLADLGNISDWTDEDLDFLRQIVEDYASRSGPLSGSIGGIGRFPSSPSSNGKDVLYCGADIPSLPSWREGLIRALEYFGLLTKAQHGYTPHVTICYLDPQERIEIGPQQSFPVTFQEVICKIGPTIYRYKLQGALNVEATPGIGEAYLLVESEHQSETQDNIPGLDRVPEERRKKVVELYNNLPEEVMLQPEWLHITGSFIYAKQGREPNDIDVVLRYDGENLINRGATLKLKRLFEKLSGKPAQVLYDASGPTWTSLPVYDLILRRRAPRIDHHDSEEFMERFYETYQRSSSPEETADQADFQENMVHLYEARKLRSAPKEIVQEADESEHEDAVKPDRFFYPMKPKRLPANEPQTLENFYAVFTEKDFPLYVSKKFDGNRMVFFKRAGRVRAFSDDGSDVTDHIPRLISAFDQLSEHDFVLDAEVELWKNGQHYPREAARSAIAKKQDEGLIANVFDKLYWEGEPGGPDLHKWPSQKRFELLARLTHRPGVQSTDDKPDPDKPINIVPQHLAKDLAELKRLTNELIQKPGAEGVVTTKADMGYPLDGGSAVGSNPRWKMHKTAEINAIVLEKRDTKGPGKVYVYGLKIDPGLTVVESRQKNGYLVVGKTFATSHKADVGDFINVEVETLNLVARPGSIEAQGYLPIVLGSANQADSLKSAVEKAKAVGMLQVKIEKAGEVQIFPNSQGDKEAYELASAKHFQESTDPFLSYPDKPNEPRPYMVHAHWRGRSVHADLRILLHEDTGIGWTINAQLPNAADKPVMDYETAKRLSEQDIWKINWQTGLFKERRNEAGNIIRASLRVEAKAPEIPKDWFHLEGATEKPSPGEAIPTGATRNFPGVFYIIDRGECTFGAQQPDAHEYFMRKGRLKGRLLIRLLTAGGIQEAIRDGDDIIDIQEADILGPGVKDEDQRQAVFWVAIQPKDQMPYVLSPKAVKDEWLPPKGVAALPPEILRKVPERLRYWEMNREQALEARKQLSEYEELFAEPEKVKKSAEEESAPFALLRHWYRGPIIIRFGPSSIHYDLLIKHEGKLYTFELERDPRDNKEIAAYLYTDHGLTEEDLTNTEEKRLQPGTKLNPTKNTPGWLTPEEHGQVEILESGDLRWRLRFKKGDLKGTWSLIRDEGQPIWTMQREAIRESGAIIHGIALVPDEPDLDGDVFPAEVIADACQEFNKKLAENPELADEQHKIENPRLSIVDSFIAPEGYELDGLPIKPGSWIIGIRSDDPDVIDKVKSGDYRGLSIDGEALVKHRSL